MEFSPKSWWRCSLSKYHVSHVSNAKAKPALWFGIYFVHLCAYSLILIQRICSCCRLFITCYFHSISHFIHLSGWLKARKKTWTGACNGVLIQDSHRSCHDRNVWSILGTYLSKIVFTRQTNTFQQWTKSIYLSFDQWETTKACPFHCTKHWAPSRPFATVISRMCSPCVRGVLSFRNEGPSLSPDMTWPSL